MKKRRHPSISRAAKAGLMMKIEKMSPNEIAESPRSSAVDFLDSKEWKAMRKRVLETYGAECMCCGYKVTEKRKLHTINVDHIKPRKFFPELALDFDNLQVLCGRCNKAKGNRHAHDYRSADQAQPSILKDGRN